MILKRPICKWALAAAAATALPWMILGAKPTIHPTAVSQSALAAKIVNYLHDYGYYSPEVRIQPGPFESSQNPAYYESVMTLTNNGKTASETVSVSKSGRHLAESAMYYLGPNTDKDIIQAIRVRYKLGTEWHLTAGPLVRSPVPGFLQTTVTAERNGQKQNAAAFYVTPDKRFAVLGRLFYMRNWSENERLIDTHNQPHSGPLNAPVTIVEYADLECPMCSRLQPFLENTLLPRYKNKVCVIYKDFPLPSHDWSHQAAIANECAYQIDPAAFVPYRTSIFAHQTAINAANVRDMLLHLGGQAGINRLRLAACLDAKTSLPRVQAGYDEAVELQVNFTPTCFINGRPVVGMQPAANYYRIIDEDLDRAKK